MGRDSALNLAMDWADKFPNRISFNILMKAKKRGSGYLPVHLGQYKAHTNVFLSEYLCQVERMLDAFFPEFGLESERCFSALCDRG